MKIVDFLLLSAVILCLLHVGGVNLFDVAEDIVRALETLPSAWQFGDGMWIADVMEAVAKIGSQGGVR